MNALAFLDYASVFVFALTGALVASRAQLDIVGFVFIACLTAVGGGTVRDVILDRPVFWVDSPSFIVVASIAAFIVFFTAHLLESRHRAIPWIDAFALAVAVPAGVAAAVAVGAVWPVIVIMGVATGCFGGLMRDVVCNEVPLVLKQGELYVTCAFAGAGAAGVLLHLGQPLPIALAGCAFVTLALRIGSIAFGWRLPVYKSRPPRA
ncbi:trimeric intracellular cation channel family protein [uncultured Litoreibacter sp.]|uniref:trimeric intracellular cation channel family protein n=1 Tax=uncultured Litoreibacter sp. TaxID=1392394 RepID=UPI002605436F|nr:trimeric intracellular cation channel family protein [uncultured Litoreibacter sp.]